MSLESRIIGVTSNHSHCPILMHVVEEENFKSLIIYLFILIWLLIKFLVTRAEFWELKWLRTKFSY